MTKVVLFIGTQRRYGEKKMGPCHPGDVPRLGSCHYFIEISAEPNIQESGPELNGTLALALYFQHVLVTHDLIVQPWYSQTRRRRCNVMCDHDGRCAWALNHWKLKMTAEDD
jgi:hypothetical protein